ncbi:MAG: T9SS type A sorting domain-containing protein [Bacteroidetes bacterium]|nr:T9SS type A sorting domain-containing protein [Bacteroidota bacterium]
MKQFFTLTFLFITLNFIGFSQKVSINSGAWNSPSTWNPAAVPVSSDNVTVQSIHKVALNKNLTGGDKISAAVTVYGNLIDQTGGTEYDAEVSSGGFLLVDGKTQMNGNVKIDAGGFLIVYPGDTLVTGNLEFANNSFVLVQGSAVVVVNGDLTNNNNSSGITVNGKVHVNGKYEGGNKSAMDGTGLMTTTGSLITDHKGTVFGSEDDCFVGPCLAQGGNIGGLPIELIYFKAEALGTTVNFNWATATEQNNNYFTIERSADGVEFLPVLEMKGAGNSTNIITYIAADKNPVNGDNYYRLKQTDFDGNFSYSKVVYATVSKNQGVRIYPNPGDKNEIEFAITATDYSGVVAISIVDVRGANVLPSDLTINVSQSGFLKLSDYGVNLTSGMYFAKVTIANTVLVERFVIK